NEIPVIVITGDREIETVVKAVKAGAFHYIAKPFVNDELTAAIDKAAKERKMVHDLKVMREGLKNKRFHFELIQESPAIQQVIVQVEKAAPTDLTIILQGKSGTGKEVFARLIHEKSARSDQPFIAVDCGALPENLVESEFFGYEKGGF